MNKYVRVLKTFNYSALFVCLFFTFFLILFVEYSKYYGLFIVAAGILALNVLFIRKGYFTLAYLLYMSTTCGLMFIFDAGPSGATTSYVYYIPLVICNFIIINPKQIWPRLMAITITLFCIISTTFFNYSPKLTEYLFQPEHQLTVSYFNIFISIAITVLMMEVMIRSTDKVEAEIRAQEREVNSKQQLLDSVAQNINVGICRTHFGSNKFLYVNKALVDLFGYDSEEEMMKVQPSTLYYRESDRSVMFNQLQQYGNATNWEVPFKAKNGRIFWVLSNTSMLKDENGDILIDVALRDISDMKDLKMELRSAKELAEKASLAKSQFLSTMSHEIRTPMNAVIGASHLLLMENPKPEQMDNLLLLNAAAENLMRLLNNVLDFSKIESGKVEFERVVIDLRKMLADIAGTHMIEAGRKRLAFSYTFDPKINGRYLVDPIRLTQVLNNLLSNAIKFTGEGEVNWVVTVEEDQAEYAKISFVVKDSGIGIAKEMHQKIFESFSQENPDTTRIYGGTGLGLAITRRILEKLDSFITLESEKGEGATFSFALLFEKATAQNRISEKAQQMSTLEGMRILLVEDNKMNITVMERFMKRWNASLDVAEDGHMAVEKTLEKTYDLILMDLHMPGMDGYQTTAAIRKTHAGLPIFALTADAFSETRDRVMAAGMNDFITKPFDPKELFNKAAQIRAKSLKS